MADAVDTVEAYLTDVAVHDLTSALERLSEEFTLEFAGGDFSLGKDDAARAMEWDVGADGRLTWTVVDASPRQVTVEGTEGNDFLDLLDVGSLDFRSTFTVDSGGAIVGQLHEVDWGDTTLDEAMAPLLAWAEVHAPEELEALRPGGRMVYTRPMAERWVALARRWRAAG